MFEMTKEIEHTLDRWTPTNLIKNLKKRPRETQKSLKESPEVPLTSPELIKDHASHFKNPRNILMIL